MFKAFLEFVFTDGILLFVLLFCVTFLVSLVQQTGSIQGLRAKLATAPLGKGNLYAALSGAIVPFCSCSTVPVLQNMLRLGVRFGFCMTFLMASPMVNEAALVVMLRYANYQYVLVFVALTMGIPVLAGIVLDKLHFGRFVRLGIMGPQGEIEGRVVSTGVPIGVPFSAKVKFAWRISLTEVRSTAPFLLLGVFIGGFIHGFVPSAWILNLVGYTSPAVLVIIMAAAGVPLYFNVVTAIPIAFELAAKGVGLGPMMAFLIGGAGTSLPEMVLLTRIFRKRLVAVHVAIMFSTAVVIGMVFLGLSS
jgi:uncharacterized protein